MNKDKKAYTVNSILRTLFKADILDASEYNLISVSVIRILKAGEAVHD